MSISPGAAGLAAYALASVIVGLNMIVLAGMTGAARAKHKAFDNAEDARGAPLGVDHATVSRLRRAQQNALESAVIFYPIALVYVLAGASATGARAYCFTYAAARVLHSVAYVAGKQPWRTVMYAIGTLAIIGMMAHLVLLSLRG